MDPHELNPPPSLPYDPPQYTLLDVMPELAIAEPAAPPPPPERWVWLPVALLFTTCISTVVAGAFFQGRDFTGWWPAITSGLMYSGAVMTILMSHEMGHFLQALRNGVYASLPHFIPFPLTPIGTFGAVIRMEPQNGDRKAIFDIGISGPLAGLVPTLIFLVLGLYWSSYRPILQGDYVYGTPLIVKWMAALMHGPLPDKWLICYHPIAFAGWVGLLITTINLIPIGQLDGGHILYGMFRKKAHATSVAVLLLAISASIAVPLTGWWLMLGLITILGTRHPPTADDTVPLGIGRYILGFLTLAFLVIGFTPVPISLGQ
jgi:membrane-associated protease RseP (regulator of RpoE activity)